jgi:hypothetical protein
MTKVIAPTVQFFSGGQITLGVDIVAREVEFNRDSATRDALIRIVPKYQEWSIEISTKKTGLLFERSGDKFLFAGSKTKTERHYASEVIPTVIALVSNDPSAPPQFLVSTPHGFQMVSSRIEEIKDSSGKVMETSERALRVVIEAKDIELASMPNIESKFMAVDATGFGIGFKADSSELSVSAGIVKRTEEKGFFSSIHQAPPAILAGFISLNATSGIRDMNAIYNARQMDMHAKIIFHGVAEDQVTEKVVTKLMEAGAKLGIKWGGLGRMIDGANRMSDQDLDRPENWINFGFAALQVYHNLLKVLSGRGGASAGAWAYAHYSSQRQKRSTTQDRPTVMQIAGELNITADEWQLIGTQIEAYRGYIKAKYLKADPAKVSHTYEHKHESADVEIPIAGNTAGISGAFGRADGTAKLAMNARIHIHEDLRLELSGHADMRGIYVSARSLEAFFDSLLLESIQDIERHSEHGAGLGLSTSDISSLSANIGKRNKHMVSEITALLGSEKATIVVANALRLNGGMIAAAHRAEDGSYSDHGLLTLRVGEFFVQHIQDYDDGYTLGAAIASDSFAPTVGGHKVSGTTFATVGKGNIECTKTDGTCQIDNARRDVTRPQERDTEYNVTPIQIYIPLGPMPTLPRTPNGKLDWKTMAENVHAQTFGAAGTVFKLAGKPFGLVDDVADQKQRLQKAIDEAEKEYQKLSAEEKKVADEYLEASNKIVQARTAETQDKVSDAEGDKTTTRAKVLHIVAEKLSALGAKYTEFEQKYPNLVQFGMSGLNVLVQTLVAGVPGLVNAAKSEVVGFGISMAIASQMNAALQSASDAAFKFIKDQVPDLSDEDALTLATAATVGLAFAWAGAMQARHLMHQLGGLKMATSAATRPVATGAVGHMDDAIDSSLHQNVASKPNTVRPSTSGVASKAADASATGIRAVKDFANGVASDLHFNKHGESVMLALGKSSYKIKNYLDDANHVIQSGTFVQELNGYIKLIGGPGKAKYAFVGLNQATGHITTFHIKTVEQLAKLAPSSGITY